MLKRNCILASAFIESPQTSHLSRVDKSCTAAGPFTQDSVASIGPYWIDLAPAWNTLFPLPHMLLANKGLLFFLFTPQSPHEALQAHLIPPLCFPFKMFNFTYYLLLWIWAPAVLTCSSSPSLPASHAQFLILLPCLCLCWSLYHPRCYCLPNSDSSAAAKVPEGSPLEKPGVFKQMPFRARLSSVVTSAHCRRGLMPIDHTSEAWG